MSKYGKNSGITSDAKAIVSRLDSLNKKLCCLLGIPGCDAPEGCCDGLNVDIDLEGIATAIAEALADLELNVDIGNICDKEFLCDDNCVTVKCRECYDPNTGDIILTTHTLLDGTPYMGDINALKADCSGCGEDKEECILIPATPQPCSTKPIESRKEECLLIPANTCK